MKSEKIIIKALGKQTIISSIISAIIASIFAPLLVYLIITINESADPRAKLSNITISSDYNS